MTLRNASRGFATSGSFLVIFVGFFLALGTAYTVAANTGERINDAGEDNQERFHALQGTAVTVTSAEWDSDSNDGQVEINVTNTGETTLSVNDTDVLVDGSYVPISAFETRTVAGEETDVWGPGERLHLVETDSFESGPERVKVVTGTAVGDSAPVTEVST